MAGRSSGFAIGFGIQDNASAGIDAINKRIAALTAPAERFNKSLAKFGEVSGINRAAEGIQTLGDRALGAARSRSPPQDGRFYGEGLVWALRLQLPVLFRWARPIPKVREHENGW